MFQYTLKMQCNTFSCNYTKYTSVKHNIKDMLLYVCVGIEMYNIFLDFNVPHISTFVLFILLKVVPGVKKKL